MSNTAAWTSRWTSLNSHIQALSLRTSQLGNDSFERKVVFDRILAELSDFSLNHFNYFHTGLTATTAPNLAPSPEFSHDYVMGHVLDRIGNDIRALQQIIEQRIMGKTNVGLKQRLQEADRIAYAALEPAIKSGLINTKTRVITYFQRDASVRVLPYVSVALVGIPLSSLGVKRDLLAIAHEVGHYVYWNAINNEPVSTGNPQTWRTFRRYLKFTSPVLVDPNNDWLEKWTEEVFADTYGALVAAGALALNFQDLAREESTAEFWKDDGSHPTSRIRQEIYLYVLKQRHNDVLRAKLAANWGSTLTAYGKPDEKTELPSGDVDTKPADSTKLTVIGKDKAGNKKVKILAITEVETKLHSLIDDILKPFLKPSDPTFPASTKKLATYIDRPSLDEIYVDFLENIDAIAADIPDANLTDEPAKFTWNSWVKTGYPNDYSTTDTTQPESWVKILNADGWTTSGPHTPPGDG